MKNTPHTAGPWHNLGPIIHREGQHIAHVVTTSVGGGEQGTETERANARLIAAAPELLELLDGLLATAEAVDVSNKNQYGDQCAGIASALFAKCHALIAKAANA